MQGNHSFNVFIAEKYGIKEALLLAHIHYWCEINKNNNRNCYENRYWTYNSYESFAKTFIYMTSEQIRRTLEKLEKKGLILTGNFNKMPMDKTKWYTLSDKGISELKNATENGIAELTDDRQNCQTIWQNCQMDRQNCQMDRQNCQISSGKIARRAGEIAKAIPDINTNINLKTNLNTNLFSDEKDYQTELTEGGSTNDLDKININESTPFPLPGDNPFPLTDEEKKELEKANKKSKRKSGINNKPRDDKPTFSKSDYFECVNLINSCKDTLRNKNIKIDETEYPRSFYQRSLKQCFINYGVENTKKGITNSISDTWLINNTQYSLTALFSDKIFPRLINLDTQLTVSLYQNEKHHQIDYIKNAENMSKQEF